MSPKTLTLLNENQIYVSWGILIGIITITAIAVKIMFQLDQLTPLIKWKSQIDQNLALINYKLDISPNNQE